MDDPKSYFDLLPEEIWERINRIVRADPTFAMIMDLPYEIQRDFVAVQMPYPDVLRFCATSKAAKKVCDDDYFWKLKIAHDFPDEPAEGYEGRWRELYKRYWKETEEKLISCASEGHLKCVESKLQLGVDPNFRGEDGNTALIETSLTTAMYESENSGIIKLLLDHGADPNIQNDTGMTALMWLSVGGSIDDVRLLLKHGAKTNLENTSGMTALLLATGNNVRVDLVRLLLESNANPNARSNKWKETPLMHASKWGHEDVVQLLLKYGADTELQNVAGKTALDLASKKGYTNIVRLLSE